MNKFLVAGNWKMNKTKAEAFELAMKIADNYEANDSVNLLICPPFPYISELLDLLWNTGIYIGAQNCSNFDFGAYTGEVSAPMLKSLKCDFVIIGHSERRQYYGENDNIINEKAKAALRSGLKVIICIGESLEERQTGKTFDVITTQIDGVLNDIETTHICDLFIAYEPIWAIGTGVAASNEQVDEAHNFIRNLLTTRYGNLGNDILLLYGGSMNESNSCEIFALKNVNGGLIGGASLKHDSFMGIYKAAIKNCN